MYSQQDEIRKTKRTKVKHIPAMRTNTELGGERKRLARQQQKERNKWWRNVILEKYRGKIGPYL